MQADHAPEAWARKAAGKPVRLADVDVVCGRCNRRRGAARTQQTPGRGQQTRLIAPTRGITPPRPGPDPRPEAQSELHTDIRAAALGAANSKLVAAKAVAS